MQILRTEITIPSERQRSEIEKPALTDLIESIMRRGLLHPPVFTKISDVLYQLQAGGRRMAAIDSIAKQGLSFFCNMEEILPGNVPITLISAETRIQKMEIELDENLIRVDLPWPDRVRALAKLHQLRTQLEPKHTQLATAKEVATKSGDTSPTNVNRLQHEIKRASALTDYLDDPKILNARTETEAYQLVLKEETAKYQSELIRRKMTITTSSLKCAIRQGNAIDIMPTMDDGQFDLILTDPPYGINAGGAGYRSRTVHHHAYDDTVENARKILQSILVEGWRLTKPKANLLIFTDIKHFQWLQELATNMLWTPWRYPVIWQKSVAEGFVPWGRNGFVHTYDVIFFATKGRRGTNATNVDILNYSRVARNERVYAAEKPVPLLSRLIELTTNIGDTVFDPCAGSGSTMVAAKALHRHSLGLEVDPQVVDLATVRINEGDEMADFSSINAGLPEPIEENELQLSAPSTEK